MYDDEPVDPELTDDEAIEEWWAWHLAHEREPCFVDPAEGPPLRATIDIPPNDYL